MNRRVVVTGLGVVAPGAPDAPSFWARLCAGQSAIGPIRNIDTRDLITKVAAEIQDFDPSAHFTAKQLPLLDRFSQFAVVAARQAVADAGLELSAEESLRTAVITGTGVGGMQTLEESYIRLYQNTSGRVHPLTVPRLMANAGSAQVSMQLGLRGPAFTVASACASATHAIGVAMQMIRAGICDRAITGGAEACLTFGTLKGWEALRVMAPDTCRPFSRDRQGMVLGEGAGMLVLETEDAARARGITPHAVLAGFGQSADARDITTPDADGMARAIQGALTDAGLRADQIQHVNAHGTGTRANDVTESAALQQVFGAALADITVTANKSVTGHALGAAGALEAVATILTLRDQLVPPIAGWLGPDPECALRLVTGVAQPQAISAALSNSFAFGGLNAVLLFSRI